MSEPSTYIKLDRNILDWEWYQDANTFRVFVHLLLEANIKDSRFQGVEVKRGEKVTSYGKIAASLGLSTQNVRTALNHLKSTGEITVKQHAKYSIVSITNYDLYQGQLTGNLTVSQQATNRQLTTNKEYKNNKNKRNNIYSAVVDYLNEKAGTSYKASSQATQRHINARTAEGFTVDDFKSVIDSKCLEWKDSPMAKYLRPETLFGTKFEGYLQNAKEKKKSGSFDTDDFYEAALKRSYD